MSRRRQAAVLVLLIALVASIFLIDRLTPHVNRTSPPPDDIEERVTQKLKEDYKDFSPVVIESWGPNIIGDELASFPAWKDARAVVRVVGVAQQTADVTVLIDYVYRVDEKEVNFVGVNFRGDRWIEFAKEGKLPAIPPLYPPQLK